MQSVDRTNGRGLLSPQLLGVCVSGDSDSLDTGKARFESGRSFFVFTLPHAFDIGSDTDDWPILSISSGLPAAPVVLSTYANGMAVVEAQGFVPNAWSKSTSDFVAHLLLADSLYISATRSRQRHPDATDFYGLFEARCRDFLWPIHPVFCD